MILYCIVVYCSVISFILFLIFMYGKEIKLKSMQLNMQSLYNISSIELFPKSSRFPLCVLFDEEILSKGKFPTLSNKHWILLIFVLLSNVFLSGSDSIQSYYFVFCEEEFNQNTLISSLQILCGLIMYAMFAGY